MIPSLDGVPPALHGRLVKAIEKSLRSFRFFCKFWLGFDPHEKQIALAEPCPLTIMACGSGAGKSTGASAYAMWEAWRHPGWAIGAFAPTNKQVKLLAQDCGDHILKGGNRFALFVDHKPTKDDPYLGINGSRIYFENTAYGADHSRGFEFNIALMDEAGMDKVETFEVVQTRARLWPGRVILLSTPRGKGGWFFEQAMLAKEEMLRAEHEGRPANRRFIHARSSDNPHYDQRILAQRKATMSKRMWDQEFEGEFVDLEGGTFNQADLDRVFDATWDPETEPRKGGLYSHGWDFGQRRSYTVGTTLAYDRVEGVQGDIRGIDQEEHLGERWIKVYDHVNAREARWSENESSGSDTIIDGTGIGTVIEESIDVTAFPFVFTKKSRGELLLRFTAAVERPGRLVLPRHWSTLYTSMQVHTSKEDTPGQTWDHLDSTALAYWQAYEKLNFGTPFLVG